MPFAQVADERQAIFIRTRAPSRSAEADARLADTSGSPSIEPTDLRHPLRLERLLLPLAAQLSAKIGAGPDVGVPAGGQDVLMTSVLIVDDHASFRKAARRVLEAEGFTVVGEAEDGASGVAESHRLTPDIVLLDVQLPDLDGFEVARRLASYPDPPIVILVSSRDAQDYGHEVERAPARAFIGKAELSGAKIAAALRKAR